MLSLFQKALLYRDLECLEIREEILREKDRVKYYHEILERISDFERRWKKSSEACDIKEWACNKILEDPESYLLDEGEVYIPHDDIPTKTTRKRVTRKEMDLRKVQIRKLRWTARKRRNMESNQVRFLHLAEPIVDKLQASLDRVESLKSRVDGLRTLPKDLHKFIRERDPHYEERLRSLYYLPRPSWG